MLRLYDTVRLREVALHSNLKIGAIGVIVDIAFDCTYLVEFCNDSGETLEILYLKENQLETYEH